MACWIFRKGAPEPAPGFLFSVPAAAIVTFLVLFLAGCDPVAGTPAPTAAPPSPTAVPTSTSVPTPTPPPESSPTPEPFRPPEHTIGVRQVDGAAEFFNRRSGETFIPRGANYVFVPYNGAVTPLLLKVGIYDPQRTRRDFSDLASRGYNTVRVFLDHCSSGPGCIGDSDNVGLNPAYLDNIADMLAAARETGIYVLFTSNDLPDQGGYAEQANAQSGSIFAGYRNSYYLTPGAVEATRRYWRDLLSGLIDRQAATDHVLGWQLLNEQWMFADQPPLSLDSGLVETTTGVYDMSDPDEKARMVSEGLIHYIAEVKAEILSLDPTALVTMGFFAPRIAAPGWYVETAPLLAGADLDFFDFHAYPGGLGLPEHAAVFGMEGYTAKPIVMGEYGAFRHIYESITSAARAISAWQAESCDFGFDGWLYWTYSPADAGVGDRTWGLTDESGALLDLLSPSDHPDPCEPVDVPSDNLAYLKPVRVSSVLSDEPGSHAVDENAETQWGAGADAPQWIEIDLGGEYRITEIRLLVAQWPEGDTVHRILGRGESGDFIELQVFSQSTSDGDWLVFAPETPITGIRTIRILTVSSPSWVAWKEIQVYGE